MTVMWRTLAAGFLGGSLAGALDALATLILSSGILTLPNAAHLIAIDTGLGAVAGAALVVVFIGWSLGLEALLGKSPWFSGTHAVALLLALPVIVYDAFAVFHGARASRIAGHHWLSVLLILLAAAAVWFAVTLAQRWLARAGPPVAAHRPKRGGSKGPSQGPLGSRVSAGGLCPTELARGGSKGPSQGPLSKTLALAAGLVAVLAALAVSWANLCVLPRLYHWLHVSLALLHLVLCLVAVRVLFEIRRPRAGAPRSLVVAGLASSLLIGLFAIERPQLASSQSLRFFIYEKTQLAGIFARALPAARVRTALSSAYAVDEALPPLPRGPRYPDADVVLITIDALRADHLGSYGYRRPTTPNLDRLASRGVQFEHAYTQAPHTSFSLASVMTGKYYPTIARLAPAEAHETLASILRRYGWKTAAFFPPAVFYIDAHKMKAFEANNFDFEYVKYEYLDAMARVGQIEHFLVTEQPKKLFLWLHLFEPHEPYELHPGFDFGASDLDRYDSEIAYADAVVGKVVDLLERRRPGAIIMIAADHGEEFGEHGGRYHGSSLYEEQVHVPFIVVAPGLRAHRVAGPSQLIDIPSTILALLDLPIPARMRGTDLGPWLATPSAPGLRLPPAFAEVENKRMVVLASDKLVCDVSKDFCSLYDLASDPEERHDLADRQPGRADRLRQRLELWLGEQARYEADLPGVPGGAEYDSVIERGRLADGSASGDLALLLKSSAVPIKAKREAAMLLATVLPPRPGTETALLDASKSSDDDQVRDWAAIAAFRGGASALRDRLRALLVGPEKGERARLGLHAALALAEGGDGQGVGRLEASLEDCTFDVALCKRVISALGVVRDRSSVRPLIEHLAFVQTRRETVLALSALADPESVTALIACLANDEYVPVRVAAAKALGRLGGARALQALLAASRHEKEQVVLTAVREALALHAQR